MKKVYVILAIAALVLCTSCGNNKKKACEGNCEQCTECTCDECKGTCDECKGTCTCDECKDTCTCKDAVKEVVEAAAEKAAE